MLSYSGMVSMPQITDCLNRGWIVVVPNHRLCPQVNILDGPVQDCRDLLNWVYEGGLESYLSSTEGGRGYELDLERVVAFGTSSGGMLALCLGFNVPRPVKAILSLYGAVHFAHPFWKKPLPHVAQKLPPNIPESFLEQIYAEYPVPTNSSISLEGQSETGTSSGPNFSRPRDAFAFTQIANGTLLEKCYPGGDLGLIDPVLNVEGDFPPTYIVHGLADTMVPIELSRVLLRVLREKGIECGMTEVPGEEHTFAAKMEVGSRTWELQRKGFDFLEEVIRRG
ncbi:hypothetical protein AWENTII_012171 [Aspergillus wentii]